MARRIMTSSATSQRVVSSIAYHLQRRGCEFLASSSAFQKMLFSSRFDGAEKPDEKDFGEAQKPYPSAGDTSMQREEKNFAEHANRSHGFQKSSTDETTTTTADTPRSRHLQKSKKKWRAPFWLPPRSSRQEQPLGDRRRPRFEKRRVNRFRDASLPCRKHLDPNHSKGFPTSDWVQIFGTLPMTSLEEVLDSIENVLRKEIMEGEGIVDLDADWNPHRDGEEPPLVPEILEVPMPDPTPQEFCEYVLDKDVGGKTNSHSDSNSYDENPETLVQMESFRIVKAHVVLSPFGRPTGWNLKFANPSVVHALLSVASDARVEGTVRIGWKFAKIREHHPSSAIQESTYDPTDTRTMLVVSDSMVRFENCPPDMTENSLRDMLSRYELTQKGSTIIKWEGRTSDGKVPTRNTFVVRFASPAYARAAIREMQGTLFWGTPMKLIQYPQQLL